MASPTEPRAETIERLRPRLSSIHFAHLGKRLAVEACGVVIGRDPALAGLALPGPAIAGRQWALELESVTGEFTVSDPGSRSAAFVNSEKVAERCLCDGDWIFAGEIVPEFSLDDALGAGSRAGATDASRSTRSAGCS